MFKRLIAIPLCIIFCIAVFSSFVFALPPNDYSTTVNCTFQLSSGLASISLSLQSGQLSSVGLWSPYSDNYVTLSSYSGIMPVSYDLYIAVLTSSLSHVYFEGLDDYYYPAGNITETVSFDTTLMYYNGGSSFELNSPIQTSVVENITFCYFRDVPAGTSFQVNDINPYPPEGTSFINVHSSYANANVNFSHYLFGFFFANLKVTGDKVLDDFSNGTINFDTALSQLNDLRSEFIDGSTDYTQTLLNLAISDYHISELVRLSGDKAMDRIRLTFSQTLNTYISRYLDGSSSLHDTLTSINSLYRGQIFQANTLEEANYVATEIDVAYRRLELYAKSKSSNTLDSAISDSDITEFDDYYQSESQLVEMFDIAEFESQLAFDTWMLQLPSDEAADYKRFFDYILNESEFRFFIIVPMCCGLISIVLGTRLVLHDRPVTLSEEDKYWKSQSENYYNFKGG